MLLGRTPQRETGRAEPVQDAGAVQKVVNEGVDGDQGSADLRPERQLLWARLAFQAASAIRPSLNPKRRFPP